MSLRVLKSSGLIVLLLLTGFALFYFFLAEELKRFFAEFSGLPGSNFTISHHLNKCSYMTYAMDNLFEVSDTYTYIFQKKESEWLLTNLLPRHRCDSNKILSSSSVHVVLFILGSRKLNHLSRHCFPILPGSIAATLFHCTLKSIIEIVMTC